MNEALYKYEFYGIVSISGGFAESNVYYKKIDSKTTTVEIQEISKVLLQTIIDKEKVVLEKKIPLKSARHFLITVRLSYCHILRGICCFIIEKGFIHI